MTTFSSEVLFQEGKVSLKRQSELVLYCFIAVKHLALYCGELFKTMLTCLYHFPLLCI